VIKAALLLLQITASVIQYLERRQLLNEGERRQLAKEMAKTAALTGLSKQVREEIGRMTHAEVDDALRGDFRD
jgi:hypothetical protein